MGVTATQTKVWILVQPRLYALFRASTAQYDDGAQTDWQLVEHLHGERS